MALKHIWSTPITTGDTRAADGADRKRMAQELHDAFIAVGLTQTTDTGQLASFDSLETELPNVADFNAVGYRTYAFHDSLSASKPVFIKVTFGGWSNTGTTIWRPLSLRFEVGTGTNGSGSVTGGIVFNPTLRRPGSTANASSYTVAGSLSSYVYAGEGILWVCFKAGGILGFNGATTAGVNRPYLGEPHPMFTLVVARTASPAGEPTSDGLVAMISSCFDSFTSIPAGGSAISESYYDTRCINYATGAVRATKMPVSRPCSDAAITIAGKLLVSQPYVVIGSGLAPIHGVSAVPAVSVGSGDTMSVAVQGLAEKLHIAPHRGASGFNYLAGINNGPASTVGAPVIDTPLLLWED